MQLQRIILIFYRLSRYRRVSENAFATLVHRFHIYRAPLKFYPHKVIKFVMATLSIHNWLMSSSNSRTRFENEMLESPDKYMPLIGAQKSYTVSVNALTMRDSLRSSKLDFLDIILN